MAKKIENLTLRAVEHLAGDDHGEYVGDDLFMAMSARKFGKQFLQTGQPYRVLPKQYLYSADNLYFMS